MAAAFYPESESLVLLFWVYSWSCKPSPHRRQTLETSASSYYEDLFPRQWKGKLALEGEMRSKMGQVPQL